MEDVEQRRQRLAAMREEAAQGVAGDGPGPDHQGLLPPSPLETPQVGGQEGEEVPEVKKASGFDFYTDPLASFSASASSAAKRRRPAAGAAPIQQQQQLPSNPPPPHHYPHPHQEFFSPPNSSFPPPPHGAHFHHHSPGVFGGQNFRPNPTTPPPPIWQPVPYQPPPETTAPPSPAFAHLGGAQTQMYPQPPSHQHHLHHQFMNQFPQQAHGRGGGRDPGWYRGGSGGSGGRAGPSRGLSSPSNSSRGGGFPGRSPAGGFWPGHEKNNYNRGTGRGQGRGGQGRGRGGGAVSAKEQPHLFYKRSMVEDPWQALLMKTDGK